MDAKGLLPSMGGGLIEHYDGGEASHAPFAVRVVVETATCLTEAEPCRSASSTLPISAVWSAAPAVSDESSSAIHASLF